MVARGLRSLHLLFHETGVGTSGIRTSPSPEPALSRAAGTWHWQLSPAAAAFGEIRWKATQALHLALRRIMPTSVEAVRVRSS